jgi:iron(III) transport system substrate-binding protein
MSRRKLVLGSSLALLVLAGAFVGVVLATSGGGEGLTIYTARSHYGDERPFETYAADSGTDLSLFGGSAPELYERLRSESDQTEADLLVTVDAANLWRAEEAGLLLGLDSATAERNVPAQLRDPDGQWFGITTRARTIMRSTERVEEGEATTYAGLGDPRWGDGRLCLRSGTSEYNISFVADRIAKDGEAQTRAMLERWMANDPEILGSDVDVLNAIADGDCDVGFTNSYYLGRELEEDPDFPVAPVWADQEGRGTHVNLSGIGVVKATDDREGARDLVEYLTSPEQQRIFAANNHEFPVGDPGDTTGEIAQFGDFKRDPIDVAGAGENLENAVQMMSEVGWE